MTDLMRDAVISMPLDMAMGDEMSRFQFHNRAQELLKQVRSLEAERDRLKNDLADAIDCKNGTGPTALSMVLSQRDRLREALTKIADTDNYGSDGGWVADSYPDEIARQALEEAR